MNVAIILHFITGGNNRIIGESKTGYLWRDKPVFYHKRLRTDLPKPRVPRFEREWAGWSNKGCNNTKKVHRNTSSKRNL